MITYSWEPGYDKFYTEAKDLIAAHWNEVGSHRDILTLRPRHDVYRRLEDNGALEILVARDSGKMIGYFFLLFSPHPRDVEVVIAQDDIIYANPAYRREWVGYKLLKLAVSRATERGALLASFHEKTSRKGGGYLKRLGFAPKEVVWTKVLAGAKNGV